MASASGVARVVERELVIFGKLWRGLAFSLFLAPVLFLAAFGLGVGQLVQRGSGEVEGMPYLAFVAPGLLAAWGAQMAAGDALWGTMAGFKYIRWYHGMVAAPLEPGDAYGGQVAFLTIRTTLSAIVFVAAAAVLGAVPSGWGVLAVPAAGLGALAVAAPLTAYSARQESDSSFPVLMRVVILPMFLLSGTVFPISQLPGWLGAVAWLSPLAHAATLCRSATTGDWSLAAVAVHVSVLAAYIAAGTVVGVRAFANRLAA